MSTIFESFPSPVLGKQNKLPRRHSGPTNFSTKWIADNIWFFLKEKTIFISPKILSYRYATLPSRKAMMAEAPRSGWLRITNWGGGD